MLWLFYHWLTFLGISLLVFEDCQSLFLRHTKSGKCITTSQELVYDSPNWAFPYFVVMTDNCLKVSAQFRYLDNELLHNIEKEGTLLTRTHRDYLGRWTVFKGVAATAISSQNNHNNRLKQTDAGSLFLYDRRRNVCAEPSTKYVLSNSNCDTEKEKFTFGSVTAYNAKMTDVHCSPKQKMVVKSAHYGDFKENDVFNDDKNFDVTCSALANCQVKSLCSGKSSCELTINNNLLPSEYCSDTSKEIYTKYTCVDAYNSSTITAAPKIRLSHQNEGYIEIKDGSIWRKVVEETWDKIRQKMLCQHLGFQETVDNSIGKRSLRNSQNIATGDLICYATTQPSGTSCCVHLQPSASTSSFRIPYVKCKICDKPLLHDAKTFLDSAFSGSGGLNNYEHARITRAGWCPSGSGTKHLILDLRKQYHITQVVVMADVEQTKWSSSYSLKYSHDTTYKYNKQITGNLNGYQVSITSLDIYNVRYMKIESTANQNFCLRIELCGEAPSGPPLDVTIKSRGKSSLDVSWKAPDEILENGEIKGYQVCFYTRNINSECLELDGTKRLSLTIKNLQPSTKYFVTVSARTKAGSGEKSLAVSEITNEKPENPLTTSYYTLSLNIPKPKYYIRAVMVIVQNAKSSSTPSENLKTSDLKPYQENMKDPYVTACLKADVLPLTFAIGDGNEYNSEKEKYINQPLKLNLYRVPEIF